ncbi:uncharacterized protein B0P05DRAFT_565305 [Gilbertella persicaria]|nr:uncharacterized protein B0P05DRAFT_565305 [Gilbertella persicaria]KAI8047854.1 hypothetical protein B0P05DRAFT_565305 [Gilbertella persicaria]
MVDLFFGLQGHVKEHMSHIHMEQRILLKRIAYADELSSMAVQTMTVALNQAKLVSEKIAEAPIMKQQAIQIQNHATHIFKALSALEEHLDPEDRISAEIRATRWPELNQLLIDAAKPMIDRYISSSSDLATVGTTSTSPLVEHMITNEQEIETSALSRLRGLSSRSLSKTDE